MRRHLAALAALLGLLLLAAGCGVPVAKQAQTLPRKGLPPALALENASTSTSSSTTTTTAPKKAQKRLTIFLVDDHTNRLVAAPRFWSQQLDPSVALGLLTQGASASEKDLTTGLQTSAALKLRLRSNGIAHVTLDSTFDGLYGQSLYLPLAQIVYTLMTNFPSIKGVNFYLEGSLFNYTPTGAAIAHPVTTKTYQSVGPLPVKKPPSKKVEHRTR